MNKRTVSGNRAAKDKPFSMGCNVTQDRWDEIFGKKKTKVKKGRYVSVGDKLVHESELPANNPAKVAEAPAVFDDRVFKNFDYGAGRYWRGGRAERREWLKREERECIG